MARTFAALLVLLTVLPAAAQSEAARGMEPAADAAREFGRALTFPDLSRLKPLLPRKGKVQMHLERLGPEQGSYSAGQVIALLDDFLEVGSVNNVQIADHSDGDDRSCALVHARAEVIDREGRPAEVEFKLTFVPEDGRWILREIRETQP